VLIQASVSGTGSGSVNGKVTFDPTVERQRPGLLLLNGVVYVGYGADNDNGAWHGWLFSFNAATLKQLDVLCIAPNGSGAGIWMGGSGLAAEVNNASQPYGRMFLSTGNGTFSVSTPYTNSMSYGMSVINLDLTGGIMTVKDAFTPYNEAALDAQDGDFGSGGPVLLPNFTSTSGQTISELVQVGKSGDIYLLNRNNLGGFNASGDEVLESVQTPEGPYNHWGQGVWGAPAYFNGTLYFSGSAPSTTNPLTAYPLTNGLIPKTPTSQSTYLFGYPAPTPVISANGSGNGIVWALDQATTYTLLAFDATNLASQLYSSTTNPSRDGLGALPGAVSFDHPIVANGKVYVGGLNTFSIYGLLGGTPTAASPVFVTPSQTFTGQMSVAITESTPGAKIYYTTDGSVPTVNSATYTGPITITSTTTVTAMASVIGSLQSPPSSATYTASLNAPNPTFSLAPGTYVGTQTVSLTDISSTVAIWYTVTGAASTSAYNLYTGPIQVPVSETIQAYAGGVGYRPSSVVSAVYTIQLPYTFNFSDGFATAQTPTGPIQFNGSTQLDDIRLQLTSGGTNQAGSAFYTVPVDTTAFTTAFTFQISNPVGDGMTFTLQNNSPTALGTSGTGLGYGGINHSVALKFDINTKVGAGQNSVGIWANGSTTAAAIDLTGTGIDLRSGDQFNVFITYDLYNFNVTITDSVTLASWSHTWDINIPSAIAASTAYAGFTGGTGTGSASQKVTAWSWIPGLPTTPNYPAGFDLSQITFNPDFPLTGTAMQITNGSQNNANAWYFATPVGIDTFTTNFDFQITPGSTSTLGEGFTFLLQNEKKNALGTGGGSLGYGGMVVSAAVAFYNFNNSTGVYVGGTIPATGGSTSLNGSGIALGGGHTIHALIVYNGSVLTLKLTDKVTAATWTGSYSVNIPASVGANTAWIGFTGAGNGATSIQTVYNWTYTTP
jgi:hypothetical protein